MLFLVDRDGARERDDLSPSHIVPLRRPSDGLVARLALIDLAERTLDLQYYLWDSDQAIRTEHRRLRSADRGDRPAAIFLRVATASRRLQLCGVEGQTQVVRSVGPSAIYGESASRAVIVYETRS